MRKSNKSSANTDQTRRRFVWSARTPDKFVRIFTIYTYLNKKWKIKIKWNGEYFTAKDVNNDSINYAFQGRTPIYKYGIKARLNYLLDDYMIKNLEIPENANIIDCGANIGEIGMGIRLKSTTVNYHAFEPSEQEHRLCQLNNPRGMCMNAALWNETRTLSFYSKKSTADSSAIEMDDFDSIVSVEAITLDEYCLKNNINDIFILKLEAEGAEPEVLEGATRILDKIRYITADCGFERGKEKSSTAPAVTNFLLSHGFEMLAIKPKRTTILFRNKALVSN